MTETTTGRAAGEGTLELLLKLNRAVQRATVYPEGHPSVSAAVALLLRTLQSSLGERGAVTIGVTSDSLLVDEQPFESGREVLGWLTRRLYDQGVGAIAFGRGLSGNDLDALVGWIARKGVPAEPPQLNQIAVTLVDYGRAQFGEDAPADDADPKLIWKSLLAGLTAGWYQGDPQSLPDDPEACAQQLSRDIDRNEGLGSASFVAAVVGAGARLPTLGEPLRQVVRARLGAFIVGLSPDLRRHLLHVDPSVSARKLDFLSEMSGSLPDTLLMEVLADLDGRGERISDSFVGLLSKLAGLSVRDPMLRELTETKLASIGLPRGLTLMDPDRARAVLEETLVRRGDQDFNPADYQAAISSLSAGSLKPARSWSRYQDISSPESIATHVSDVVLRLLVASPEHPDAPAYMRRLAAERPRAVETGRFAQLQEVAQSLKDLLVLRNYIASEVVRQAEEYLAALRGPEAMRRLLAAIENTDAPLAPELEGLFRLGGSDTAGAALERIAALSPGDASERLQRLVASLRPEVFAEVVARLRALGGAQLGALFAVLARPDTPGRVECALTFLGNRQPAVRRQALAVLLEADLRPGQKERYLQRALADAAMEVRQLALETLRGAGSDLIVTSLRSYLLSARPSRQDLVTHLQAIEILDGQSQPEAGAALADVLRAGRLRLRMVDVRRCREAAARLAHRDDQPARDALRSWRRSPSGLAAWLFGHGAEEDA